MKSQKITFETWRRFISPT